tara:strand:- start:576 stop:863 length:288 start_codon:yes stop_codon:yes gene_type:complete
MHAAEIKLLVKDPFYSWVEKTILPKFQESFGSPIVVWETELDFLYKNRYGKNRILNEMQMRGLTIKFFNKDSPLWLEYDFRSVNTTKGTPIFVSM